MYVCMYVCMFICIYISYCRKRLENPISIVLSNSIVSKCCRLYGNILEIKLLYCGRGPVFFFFFQRSMFFSLNYKNVHEKLTAKVACQSTIVLHGCLVLYHLAIAML